MDYQLFQKLNKGDIVKYKHNKLFKHYGYYKVYYINYKTQTVSIKINGKIKPIHYKYLMNFTQQTIKLIIPFDLNELLIPDLNVRNT